MGLINIENITPDFLFEKTKVFVNGRWLGIHEQPKITCSIIKTSSSKRINKYFYINLLEYKINGNKYFNRWCCCRPLYHMENNKLSITTKHIQDLKSNKKIG